MADVCIAVLCGLPASGKTDLSQQLLKISKKDQRLPYHFLVIEYDELLPTETEKVLIEGENGNRKDGEGVSLWKRYRRSIHSCVDFLISQLLQSSDSYIQSKPDTDFVTSELWGQLVQKYSMDSIVKREGKPVCVVIDDNMYYRSMRYSYFQLARKYNTGYCQIYLQTDVETAVIRNKQRCFNGVVRETILQMAERFEVPDSEKYTWENNTLALKDFQDLNDLCLQNVCCIIDSALSSPVESLVEEDIEGANQARDICSASFLHQSDQILRKLISVEMCRAKEAGMTKADLKTLAAHLQIVRKDISCQLKEGEIKVPLPKDISCQLKEGEIKVPLPILSLSADASKDDSSDLFLFLKDCFKRKKEFNHDI